MDLRSLAAIPHRRYDPLADRWLLVSPQRTQRPWQGQVERLPPLRIPAYDPGCYLCPGNRRAGERQNPTYIGTFVFQNDFPALLPGAPGISLHGDGLLHAETERGICRVICFSPHHDLTLALMQPADIVQVVVAWQQQFTDLAALPGIFYVQIFENRGEMMGASNPHPHGQIWATEHLPDEPAVEDRCQRTYFQQRGGCLLCTYQAAEGQEQVRTVVENEDWLVVVPFWAVWPFESLVLSKAPPTFTGSDI